MKYKFNGKEIRIPDEVIDNYVDTLDLSIDEAIQLFLEEEGYIKNEEVEKLTKQAKDNRITATIHEARAEAPKKREVERKADPTKEGVIQLLAEALKGTADNIQITNIGKIIEFELGGDKYKIDLIRRRQPKGGK